MKESMTDNFVHHQLEFEPAEPMQANETSIRVLENSQGRGESVQERFEEIHGAGPEQVLARQQLNEEIRKDPAYKFLLQVAAFAKRRINKLTEDAHVTNHPKIEHKCDLAANLCFKPSDVTDNDWMQIPEISGVIHLSADAYGHIKEAEMIANNFIQQPLKTLMENKLYQTLFARLVAIRMGVSSILTHSESQKDRAFERLHQEQSMVLRALQRIRYSKRRKWTEPGYY